MLRCGYEQLVYIAGLSSVLSMIMNCKVWFPWLCMCYCIYHSTIGAFIDVECFIFVVTMQQNLILLALVTYQKKKKNIENR